jgi:hypothetical protein
MAVSKPRNRTLIFRLTQDEYDSLQMASTGSRSLSEFARTKLMGSIETEPLHAEITDLKVSVRRISELLENRVS